MKILISTMFSLSDPSWGGGLRNFRSAESDAEYLARLFSPERMAFKFAAFEKLTKPSMDAALRGFEDAEWLIYTSPSGVMPAEHFQRLEALLAVDSRYKLIPCNSLADMNHHYNERMDALGIPKAGNFTDASDLDVSVCTVRMDDDDGIHEDYFRDLERLASQKAKGFTYTCARCRLVGFEGVGFSKKTEGSRFEQPSPETSSWPHVVGLAAVGFNVRTLGDHTKFQERFPNIELVVDRATEDAVLMGAHSAFTATARGFK